MQTLTDNEMNWIMLVIRAKSQGKIVQWQLKSDTTGWLNCLDKGHVWNFDLCNYRIGIIQTSPDPLLA